LPPTIPARTTGYLVSLNVSGKSPPRCAARGSGTQCSVSYALNVLEQQISGGRSVPACSESRKDVISQFTFQTDRPVASPPWMISPESNRRRDELVPALESHNHRTGRMRVRRRTGRRFGDHSVDHRGRSGFTSPCQTATRRARNISRSRAGKRHRIPGPCSLAFHVADIRRCPYPLPANAVVPPKPHLASTSRTLTED